MEVNDPQENYVSGWIRIYRSIQDHWIWKDSQKLKWWLDLMLETNHSEKKVAIGYEVIECKRGQTIRSLSGWAERWNVSKDTARNFLEMLKKDGMIHTENMGKTTRITILNYDTYQSPLHDKQTTSKRKPNDEQTTPIHKQELNNEKKKDIPETFLLSEEQQKLWSILEGFLKSDAPELLEFSQPMTPKQYFALREEFESIDIEQTIRALANKKNAHKTYVSVYRTLLKWLQMNREKQMAHAG